MQMHTVRGVLEAKQPFDFGRTLSFVCSFGPTAGEQQVAERSLTKAITVKGRTILFEVREAEDAKLRYALHSTRAIDEATHEEAARRLRFFLSLDDDLAPFYAIAEKDAAFRPVVRKLRGMHHVKFASLTEIATWSILTQRTPIPVARRKKDALVEKLGGKIEKDGITHRAFPDARTLVDAGGQGIGAYVRDPRRAEAIAVVAHAIDERGEAWFREAPYDEVDRFLRSLPRIGEWSAAFILFRGLGRMERMSRSGGPIYEAVRSIYQGVRGDVSDDAIDRIAETYGPWRGYWSLYSRVAA